MWLHVRPWRAEQLLRALDGERLGYVDVLAAAVVTLPWVAFGVLVRELAALGQQDLTADIVLRGDQLDVVFLPLVFTANGVPHLGIGLGEQIRRNHFSTTGRG